MYGEEVCMQGFGMKKPEDKRTLEKFRRRWEDNIKMCLFEKWDNRGMDWIDLGQDRDR